jgi:TatD DNase family protein
MFIDTHVHLTEECYSGDLDEVLRGALESGVTSVIVPGCDLNSSLRALELAAVSGERASLFPRIYAAVGYHPHEAKECLPESLSMMESLFSSTPSPVAVGETGLDYHYNFSPPEIQREVFRIHIRMARTHGLPLILHCREAEEDLFRIMEEEGACECGGVVHCFSGSPEWALRFLEKGYYLGITGVVTFRKAEELRSAVRDAPLERLLTETDGPYLVPQPHRGKIKRNVPAYIPLVAERIAAVRGLPLEETAPALIENARRLFGLDCR